MLGGSKRSVEELRSQTSTVRTVPYRDLTLIDQKLTACMSSDASSTACRRALSTVSTVFSLPLLLRCNHSSELDQKSWPLGMCRNSSLHQS